jgi:hypothetical protein
MSCITERFDEYALDDYEKNAHKQIKVSYAHSGVIRDLSGLVL